LSETIASTEQSLFSPNVVDPVACTALVGLRLRALTGGVAFEIADDLLDVGEDGDRVRSTRSASGYRSSTSGAGGNREMPGS
jgi:hypothetical protein